MELIRWRDSLCLGIADVDEDHKRLVGLLNRLHFMALAGDDSVAIGDVLDELVAHIIRHFRREEALMLRIGYPDREEHTRQHAEFRERLTGFQDSFEQGARGFDTSTFYDFLADWLIVHLTRDDLKLKPYVEALAATTAAA